MVKDANPWNLLIVCVTFVVLVLFFRDLGLAQMGLGLLLGGGIGYTMGKGPNQP